MYLILILLHGIFIVSTHLLWYYILEGIFILFFLFFLLYFSPIFFSKKDTVLPDFSFSKISFSLENSILLPMIFFYIAWFFLLFAVTWDFLQSFHYNILLFLGIYAVMFLYIGAFDWKNDVFFDIARIHLGFTYGIIFSIVFWSFFYPNLVDIFILVLVFATCIFSIFYFSYTSLLNIIFFQWFLGIVLFIPFIISVFFLWSVSYSFFLFSFGIVSIILFEWMPKLPFFDPYLPISKIYVLIWFMVSYLLSLMGAFFDVNYFSFIFIGIIFLFFTHIRYSNYIALFGAIFWIFFLYSLVFASLLTPTSILSTLLFIFFLPLCIIGNTYFWEERFEYDFKSLHYSSILFSVIFSAYSLVFLSWGSMIMYILSLSVFSLGFLLFLSYFRFRIH